MRSEIVAITPALAEDYLSTNTINRHIRKGVVDRYAKDMAMGRWETTHQGIALAKDGTLLDGQHRLYAVIKSGATVPMLVTTGLDVDAFASIDKLVPRSDADSLRIDRRVVECAKFFLMYTRSQSKPSIIDVADVCARIEGLYNRYMAGKNVRIYSCVPIRCAALVAMALNPGREAAIGHQYASLIAQDYESMSNGVRMLSKALNTGQIGKAMSYTARIALFCRALPVFREERDERARLGHANLDYGAECIAKLFGDIINRTAEDRL